MSLCSPAGCVDRVASFGDLQASRSRRGEILRQDFLQLLSTARLGMLFATRLLGLAKFPISELPISVATVIVTIVSILLITPAAYLSWRFIEIPFVSFGKNIGLRLVQAPLPSQ